MNRACPHSSSAPRRARVTLVVMLLVAVLVVPAIVAAGCGSGAASERARPARPPSTQGPPSARGASPSRPPALPATTQPSGAATQASVTVSSLRATAGSPGARDPYFPDLGNGGYDVQSHDISLAIDPGSGRISGRTAVEALALQNLSAFYLDLRGLDVSAVNLDGASAGYERIGEEPRIDCPSPIPEGARFTATVTYSGVPTAIVSKLYTIGWQKTGDTIFTLDEPQGAATWFPVNDTPADKATYTFRLTAPEPYTATANGVLSRTEAEGTSTTCVWTMDRPMASYLAAVSVGRFTTETSTSAGGTALRNYFATDGNGTTTEFVALSKSSAAASLSGGAPAGR